MTERAVHSIASKGGAHGIDSRVLTVSPRGGCDEADLSGYRIKRYAAWRSGGSPAFIARFRREAAWADLLHFHFPWPCAQWAYLLGRVAVPAMATVHADAAGGGLLARRGRDGFLARMRRIIVTSPNYLEGSAILRGLHGKVEVVPAGIEDLPARDPEAVWRWRQRIGQRFFVFLGGLRDYKGLHYLLDAMQGRDYPLAVAGDGPERPALEAHARAAGLRSVRFLGPLGEDDKHDLLAAAYGFVLPSCRRDEVFGLPLVEASVHGLPMISCEVGTGTSFVNLHQETGLVVPPCDARALGAALDRFWLEPAQATAWGEAARRRYVDHFTEQAMVARHAACYGAILGRAPEAGGRAHGGHAYCWRLPDTKEATMPIDPRRGRPASPASRPSHPSTPSNLPEAAVDETGNEDPGAELTELPEHEKQEQAGIPPDERGGRSGRAKHERTVGNQPVDPNSMPSRIGLPVGVDREAAADPGRQTPEAPETDNRS